MGFCLAFGILVGPSQYSLRAETLDRVVASVDNRAITETEVQTEYRLEQFADGRMPDNPPDQDAWNQARDRLIDQELLAEEMAKSITPAEPLDQPEEEFAEIRKNFQNPAAFDAALKLVGLDRVQIVKRFERRDRILHMIEQRLHPDAWINQADIETYYQKTFVPEFTQRHPGPAPPLDNVEDPIREILIQHRINQLLVAWLEELRSSHRVEIHSF